MPRSRTARPAGARVKTFLGVMLLLSLMAMGWSATASATPKGEWAVFADCPLTTADACVYATTESGEFVVGNKTVPIEKTITLQGGLKENPETAEFTFVAAADGNTLSKTPQKVPGGLAGLVKCNEIKGSGLLEVIERGTCEATFENGLTGVTATTELAAPASAIGINLGNLINGTGVALSLPVKVHLENPLLGSSCYLGSNSSPLVLPLTTGTTSPPPPNTPIKGNPGKFATNPEGTLLTVSENSLVNNEFAAPATNGCGGIFEFLIGPVVNSSLGVPSAAGHNTAILNGTLKQAGAEIVQEHE
jgi:hypothetical protein